MTQKSSRIFPKTFKNFKQALESSYPELHNFLKFLNTNLFLQL